MAENIAIEELEAQSVVEVAAETRLWKIPKTLSAGFTAARNHIVQSGAQVSGMPFARYLEIDWDAMRNQGAFGQFMDLLSKKQKMRPGLPVSRPLESEGIAEAGEIAAGRYLTAIHRGAYHKVGETYRELVDWAATQHIGLADSSIEMYIDDPESMQMQNVRTRILIAIID